MADEPMSDERLAEIRARAEAIRDWLLTPESDGNLHFPTSRRILGVDALALLAEVDRLRAREAAALEMLREMTDYSELTLGAVNGPLYRRARALLAEE